MDVNEINTVADYLDAVKNSGISLGDLPYDARTSDICFAAVSDDPLVLADVPQGLRSHEMCENALSQQPITHLLKYIPFADLHDSFLDNHCRDYHTTRNFIHNAHPDCFTSEMALKVYLKAPDLASDIVERLAQGKLRQTSLPENSQFRDYTKHNIQQEMFLAQLRQFASSDKILHKLPVDRNDPKEVALLFNLLGNAGSVEGALELVKKNGDYLFYLKPEVVTTEVADAAVRNSPQAIQWVPLDSRTPDMILFAEKSNPGLEINKPSRVLDTKNIYTFHKKVEDAIGKPLSYDDHKKLYSGKPVVEHNLVTPKGVMKDAVIKYDPKTTKLRVTSLAGEDKKLPVGRTLKVPPKKKNGTKISY